MKKIYLKNLNLNKKNIKKIDNKNKKKITYEKNILTNNGIYKFMNNKLYNFDIIYKLLDENDLCYEIYEKYFKEEKYQIPYDYEEIMIEKHIFSINEESKLYIEYYKNKLHDYYIISNIKLNINNNILKEEISYIQNLLI